MARMCHSVTEGTDSQVVRGIVFMGEGMGLDVDEDDVEELKTTKRS